VKCVPRIIGKKVPVAPGRAIQAGIYAGSVIAHVYVAPDGKPEAVRIIRTQPAVLYGVFNRTVQDALIEWGFDPPGCRFIAEISTDFKVTGYRKTQLRQPSRRKGCQRPTG